ncbi:MAG: flagellar motor protein MotB, partial [Croceibacterium sp.]
MRKLALGLAIASTALTSPALARDDAWYVEGGFGALLVEDYDYSRVNSTDSRQIFADGDKGYDADLLAGYDFGMFRLEAEAGYKRFDLRGLNANFGIPVGTSTALSVGKFTTVG